MLEGKDIRPLFLLSVHNKSSPRLRLLRPQTFDDKLLEEAARDYCTRRIIVGSKDITLPAIFFWFHADLFSFTAVAGSATHPILSLPWLSQAQIKGITKLLQSGPLRFNYKYDWTPHPKPMIGAPEQHD